MSSFEHGWPILEFCKCPNAMQALIRAAQSTDSIAYSGDPKTEAVGNIWTRQGALLMLSIFSMAQFLKFLDHDTS